MLSVILHFRFTSEFDFSVNRTEIIHVFCLYCIPDHHSGEGTRGSPGGGAGPAIRAGTSRGICCVKQMRNFSGMGNVVYFCRQCDSEHLITELAELKMAESLSFEITSIKCVRF